jgi:uncharacterized protein
LFNRKAVRTLSTDMKYKASRYNVLTNVDNKLIIYNSFKGVVHTFDDSVAVKKALRGIFSEDKKGLQEKLIELGFLVPVEWDEIKMATAQKYKEISMNRRLHIVLLPNEQCNFRCLYCYEDFIKHEMSTDIQQGVLKFLTDNISLYDSLEISWFGGEPLLSTNVIQDMSKKMIALCAENNKGYSAGITTNGYNLDFELFKELCELKIYNYQITLDGPEETHDKFRVRQDGEKTFKVIFDNLLKIKNSSIRCCIVVRSNVSKDVAPYMKKYIDLMSNHFSDDRRFFLHFVTVLDLKGTQDSAVHLCDTKDLFTHYEYALEKNFSFDFYKSTLKPSGSECYASNPNSLVIGSDGMVYKCTVAFNNPMNHVGNINSLGELEIYEDRWSLWVTGGTTEDEQCVKCFFRPACQGNACPLQRIETNTTPCPPVKKNLKKYIELIERGKVVEV